jgi:hypothetical protein
MLLSIVGRYMTADEMQAAGLGDHTVFRPGGYVGNFDRRSDHSEFDQLLDNTPAAAAAQPASIDLSEDGAGNDSVAAANFDSDSDSGWNDAAAVADSVAAANSDSDSDSGWNDAAAVAATIAATAAAAEAGGPEWSCVCTVPLVR